MHDGFVMWYCGEVWAGSNRGSANRAAPSGSLGCSSYSQWNAFSRNERLWVPGGWGDWGSVSVVRGAEHFLTHWLLQAFPCLGTNQQVLFRLIPESAVCCCRTIHALPVWNGTCCSLSKWTQQGSGAAELPSPVSAQHHLTSKPHHETVLLLSDHVTSLKLCGGSTKSPVFSFAKLSQVIQSPECFFCQSEFAVIKLHSCEG